MKAIDSTGEKHRAGRLEWIGLAVLALPTLLLALDMSVLYLALPNLAADLQPSGSQLLWIMDIYGFMIAGFLITMGTLGDRIGRRRLLLIGSAAFGVASVLAAYSTSAEMLIGARTVLGIAGATLMPSTLALISNMFKNPKQRAVAIAVWSSCFMGGTAIGPVIGGVLLDSFWWGSVFLVGVPVMALLLVTGPVLLPEYRDMSAGRLDLTSVALSLAAVLPFIYGLKQLAVAGGTTTGPLAAIVTGVVVGVLFIRRQLRLADPLLDLGLFRRPSFGAALGVMMAGAVVMGGMFLISAQYVQLIAELSPLEAGFWLALPATAMVFGTMLALPLAQRIGQWSVIGVGLVGTATACVLLTQIESGGPFALVAPMMLAAAGVGPGAALVTDIVVGSAPPEKAGSAASMSETSAEFGIATGVALLGSIGTAVYRSQVVVPAEVSAHTTTAVRESLAGAVVAADRLPANIATPLLESARGAFTDGLNVAAGASAVVMIVSAVLALAIARRDRHRERDLQPSAAGRASVDTRPE